MRTVSCSYVLFASLLAGVGLVRGSMYPESVTITKMGQWLAREVQICCPGIECRNHSLTCGPDYICVLRTESPSPTPSYEPSPSQTVGLTPVPSKSYVPSESAMPAYSVMVAQSPTVKECNSCHDHSECITTVCHHGHCIWGGSKFHKSMLKCFGASYVKKKGKRKKIRPHASQAPVQPPVLIAWR